MSTIDKMHIRGIRSFSPDNKTVIEFYKPLTLIVGHNGAGKTTIIECLKMACTGELPPNTRSGQSFIHDPKVAGETEVKAQIKLRFYNAIHAPFVVVRSFQLTQKANTLKFKTLDSTLTSFDPNTGEKIAVSNRCIKMNENVPQIMGVSKAILENVIFVHQEDSSWPLAENKTLKDKFDDIFASTKYSKALDDIRKKKTVLTGEIKEGTHAQRTLKALRDQALRLKSTVTHNEHKAYELEKLTESLKGQIKDIASSRAELNAQLAEIVTAEQNLQALRMGHQLLVAKNEETYQRLSSIYELEDLEMSERELEELESSLGPTVAQLQTSLHVLESQFTISRDTLDNLSHSKTRVLRNCDVLSAEEDAYKRAKKEKNEFLQSLIGSSGTDVSDADAALFKQQFMLNVSNIKAALTSALARHKEDEDAIKIQLDDAAKKIARLEQEIATKEAAAAANTERIEQLQSILESSSCYGSQASLEAAQDKEKYLRQTISQVESNVQAASAKLHERKAEIDARLAEMIATIEKLRAERRVAASTEDEIARLRHKSQDVEILENKLQGTVTQHRSSFALCLRVAPTNVPKPGKELTSALFECVKTQERTVEEVSQKYKETQQQTSNAKASLDASKRQMDEVCSEISRLELMLASKSWDRDMKQSDLESEKEEKMQHVSASEAFSLMFQQQCRVAKQSNMCMTCKRSFASEDERDAFIQRQEQEAAALPNEVARLRQEVANLESRLVDLRAVEPTLMRLDELKRSTLPVVEATCLRLSKEVESLNRELQTVNTQVQQETKQLSLAQKGYQDALHIDRLATEIESKRYEIATLSGTMAGRTRSVTNIDDELAVVEAERGTLEREKERVVRDVASGEERLSFLRGELYQVRESIMAARSEAEDRRAAEERMTELLSQTDVLAAQIAEARAELEPILKHRLTLESNKSVSEQRAAEERQRLEAKLGDLETKRMQLESRERVIQEYEDRGSAVQLQSVRRELESICQEVATAETHVSDLLNRVEEQKTQIRESEAFAKQLKDVLAYQRGRREERVAAAQLDSALGCLHDKSPLESSLKELDIQEKKMRSEFDQAIGSLATLREAVRAASKELEASQYKNIHASYRSALVELQTRQLAAADLDRYHKALERALLSFHTNKMADINKTIKELWQKTYCGCDIDYIQIKADIEGTAASRSYSYRVVMMCGGTELDMRGRCSAGQRVLACLIIRLALAETFCLNCGILALDEPTTNLDSDNAAALAEALQSIMMAREKQENFQLIVITHDEEFAKAIGTRDQAHSIWRISKDENQHSNITKEPLV